MVAVKETPTFPFLNDKIGLLFSPYHALYVIKMLHPQNASTRCILCALLNFSKVVVKRHDEYSPPAIG